MVLSEKTRQRLRAERLARRCEHCARPGIAARGLCHSCYYHLRTYGALPTLLNRPRSPERAPRRCWHCHAPDHRIVRGLCGACYEYWRKRGHLRDLDAPLGHPTARADTWGREPQQRLAQRLVGRTDLSPLEVQRVLWQVAAALPLLPPRHAFVVAWRGGIGGRTPRSLRELAQLLGVSHGAVQQWEQQALAMLRPHLCGIPLSWERLA